LRTSLAKIVATANPVGPPARFSQATWPHAWQTAGADIVGNAAHPKYGTVRHIDRVKDAIRDVRGWVRPASAAHQAASPSPEGL